MTKLTGIVVPVAVASIAAGGSIFGAWSSYKSSQSSAESAANSSVEVALLQKKMSDRQLDIEMLKLALNILGGEKKPENEEIRKYAVEIIKRFSGWTIKDEVDLAKWKDSQGVTFFDKELGLQPAPVIEKPRRF